jgi:exosortase family protein XrtF
MIQEFKPVILFLIKFLVIYFVGSILYGLWVSSFEPKPDPFTYFVTEQTSWLLDVAGWETVVRDSDKTPTAILLHQGKSVISVYEGCNGINIFIMFVSFLFAFGPWVKQITWYAVAGLAIIHVANLFRVTTLFYVALYFPGSLYFIHKYLFTVFIYAVVFILWIVWVKKFAVKLRSSD